MTDNKDVFNKNYTTHYNSYANPAVYDKQRRAVELKEKAEELYAIFNTVGFGTQREAVLAKEKLEEAVMWAVKGIHNEA